jgi:hypothetical protein
MPLGSVPVVHGGELFLLHGPKEQVDRAVPIDQVWRIKRTKLLALDLQSFAESGKVP